MDSNLHMTSNHSFVQLQKTLKLIFVNFGLIRPVIRLHGSYRNCFQDMIVKVEISVNQDTKIQLLSNPAELFAITANTS